MRFFKKFTGPFRGLIRSEKRRLYHMVLVVFIVLLFTGLNVFIPRVREFSENTVKTVQNFLKNPQKEARSWQKKKKGEVTFGKIKKSEDLSEKGGVLVDNSFDYTRFYEYEGKPYLFVNNNHPNFSLADINSNRPFEDYSPLDKLGRVGVCNATITKEMMPKDKRESIQSVKPSGWKNKKYDESLVDGGWVYNRCHLIGFQLTGENANPENLMTGTRSLNTQGMLPFENEVAEYVRKGGVVRYRVTPVFYGEEPVARGVYMEAQSLDTPDVSFFVYVFNNQPGITIDYETGETSKN